MVYLILAGTAWWIFRLATRPFKNCRRCKGLGRIPARTGRGRAKLCRRCEGTGLTARASARIAGYTARHVRNALDRETAGARGADAFGGEDS